MRDPSINIRPAEESDILSIAQVHHKSWHDAYIGRCIQSSLDAPTLRARTDLWESVVSQSRSEKLLAVFVAEVDDYICGFISAGTQRSNELKQKGFEGEITALYILNQYQRRGIGQSLMATSAEHFLQFGVKSAALWVLATNDAGKNFYSKLGGLIIDTQTEEENKKTQEDVAFGWTDLSYLKQ